MVLCFYLIFLRYPMKMKKIGLTESKLFHSIGYLKTGGGGGEGCLSEPPEPPLDPPLI